MVGKICDFIEELAIAKVVDEERDFIHYGDEMNPD